MDISITSSAYHIRHGDKIVSYPRVTEIIKIAGLTDFSRVNKEVLERAGNFGKSVHLLCRYYDEGTLDKYKIDPLTLPYLEGWKKFRAEIAWARKKPDAIEKTCWSDLYGYAGTPDRVWRTNLVDIKTGETINKKECGLQTIAYEKLEKGIEKRWIVQLKPDGYKLIPCTNPQDWNVFSCCLNIYKFRNRKE